MGKQQPLVKQNDTAVIEKAESPEMTASTESSESGSVSEGVEDLKVNEVTADLSAESASDNSMVTDSDMNPADKQIIEAKEAETTEGDKKEIARQNDSEEKEIVEPKS